MPSLTMSTRAAGLPCTSTTARCRTSSSPRTWSAIGSAPADTRASSRSCPAPVTPRRWRSSSWSSRAPRMPTFRLTLEYDGTDFHGWQLQPGTRTVEGALRAALRATREAGARITAAGRTDAGAHAHGQVAGVTTERDWRAASLAAAINAALPDDVVVV